MIPYHRKDEDGLTLVEIMISSVILVIITGAILISLIAGNKSFVFGSKAYEVQQQVHMLMDKMTFDIRQARKITTAEADDIRFLDENGQEIGYYLLNGDLYNLNGTKQNRDVTIALNITYYDKRGDPVTPMLGYFPSIWSVELDITTSKDEHTMNLNNEISLRNVKLVK